MRLTFKSLIPPISMAASFWITFWIANIIKHSVYVWWDIPFVVTAILFTCSVTACSIIICWFRN